MADMIPPPDSDQDYERPSKEEINQVKVFGLKDYQIELIATTDHCDFGPDDEVMEKPIDIKVTARHALGFDDDTYRVSLAALLDEMVEIIGPFGLKGPIITQSAVDTVAGILEREIVAFRERHASRVVPDSKVRHDYWEWEGAPTVQQ